MRIIKILSFITLLSFIGSSCDKADDDDEILEGRNVTIVVGWAPDGQSGCTDDGTTDYMLIEIAYTHYYKDVTTGKQGQEEFQPIVRLDDQGDQAYLVGKFVSDQLVTINVYRGTTFIDNRIIMVNMDDYPNTGGTIGYCFSAGFIQAQVG